MPASQRTTGAPARRAGLRAELLAAHPDVDAILITDLVNVRYLSGFTGSNGAVLVWGNNSKGQCSVPWQLATRECVEIAIFGTVCFARCSDGEILIWGDPLGGYTVPGLPFGVTYVGARLVLTRWRQELTPWTTPAG